MVYSYRWRNPHSAPVKNRGYTREKSLGIIGNQASEDYFRAHTDFVVENNGNVEKTWKQVDEGVRRNETL